MMGDIPPVTRAHTATVVDRRLFIFGGGDGPHYYNDTYVFDTGTRARADSLSLSLSSPHPLLTSVRDPQSATLGQNPPFGALPPRAVEHIQPSCTILASSSLAGAMGPTLLMTCMRWMSVIWAGWSGRRWRRGGGDPLLEGIIR